MTIGAPSIPASPGELERAFLEHAALEAGLSTSGATLGAHHLEPLGVGEGFAASLVRIHLEWHSGSGPATVIGKFPASDPDHRARADLVGAYEREVAVYTELLPTLDVPAPQLVFAAAEPDPSLEAKLAAARVLERVPSRLLTPLVRLGLKSRPSERRSVLLLEDVGDGLPGDQVAGCDLERADQVLAVAARLHAATWGERAPAERPWFLRRLDSPKLFHAGFAARMAEFEKQAGHHFAGATHSVLGALAKNGLRRISDFFARTQPCLLHGDLRLDNIFFHRPTAAASGVRALVDWQLTGLGPPAFEVAYFLSGSLPAETSQDDVRDLLAGYHAGLVAGGVEGYPLSRLLDDHDDGLWCSLAFVASLDVLDGDDPRGRQLADVWASRLAAHTAHLGS